MPDFIVMEPPTHHTITYILQIRMDAQFAADYDKYVEVCRAIYNRAVHEAALDGPERRTYAPYQPKERIVMVIKNAKTDGKPKDIDPSTSPRP
ncbi:MAG: hypothetical protein J4G04_04835, partial [Nitrosopumilaceae archaeon]|nr:hypothetical protein [Nitrosopumilaceae archaeon]